MTPFQVSEGISIRAVIQNNFESWRDAARSLLAADVPPAAVSWADAESADDLLLPLDSTAVPTGDPSRKPAPVPRAFLDLARVTACHRDAGRWELLYRVLWRLTQGERHLLDLLTDSDVHRLMQMEKAVRRDRHKMTAFVRFKRIAADDGGPEQYVAWHRPDHFIVRLTAPFFARRFASLRWTILTPDASAAWDGERIAFGPGVPASAAPAPDELEDLWRTYYANIFNPARIKVRAMKREMPVRHWPTLPETDLIPDLLRDAPRRVEEMMKRATGATQPSTRRPIRATPAAADTGAPASSDCPTGTSAAEFLPATLELPQLREASRGCRGCELYCKGTQTVFGEGPATATVMFVGEQPGDQEDRAGRPFIGPAGQVFNEALQQAGIPRDEVYVTNAVKHFKWEPRGTRRIHAKPGAREISACRPWLEAEIQVIQPKMIVCLGATAAQTLLGRDFRVTQHRGEVLKANWAPWMLATVHPSSLLRIPDEAAREEAYAGFLDDMKVVSRQIKTAARS